MLRGVWGAALCQLNAAVYHRLFEGGREGIPFYVMRPAPAEVRPAPALEFILIGVPDPEVDEYIWAAWDHALSRGLGFHRKQACLVEVRSLAWDGTALAPGLRQPGFRLYPLPWPGGDPASPCRLAFPAPLRLMRNGRLILEPALPDLIIGGLRRLQGLAGESGTAVWDRRHDWLGMARSLPAGPWSGGPLDLVRYSGRQQREVEQRGVAGELPLPAGPGLLTDLLAAMIWLHLGKGTVMGLGQMTVGPLMSRSV
jgi:hypothetical protein